MIPYLADAVPGWFQATLTLRDADGKEVAYADDFRFHPDPVFSCVIPKTGRYMLEIKDAIYRGREDFVYRVTLGEVPLVTSVFPLGASLGEEATVELTAILGGIDLFVPREWKVIVDSSAILGGVDDKHRATPATTVQPTLYVKATAILGGIDIKN